MAPNLAAQVTTDAATTAPRLDRRALVALLTVLATAAVVLVTTVVVVRARADRSRAQSLDRTLALEARWVRARLERLEVIAAELLTAPPFPERDETVPGAEEAVSPQLDRLAAFASPRGLDLAAVFDAEGAAVWSPAAGATGASGADNSDLVALVRRLGSAAASAPGARSGLVSADGGLHGVAYRSSPAVGEGRPATVVVAQRIDRQVVSDLDQAIPAELAFLVDVSGPALAAASLEPRIGTSLPIALRERGSWRSLLEEAGALQLELDGETWDAQLAPLPGLEGPQAGVAAALLPLRNDTGLSTLLLLETGLALISAAAIALLLLPPKRKATEAEPKGEHAAEQLAAALSRARRGGPFTPPEKLPPEYERLSQGLGEVVAEQQRLQRETETTRGRGAIRFELATADDPLHVAVEDLALLAVELRGLARSETVKQPQIALSRVRRDLELVRRAVERHGGRVEAWLGHRLLASFAGERSVLRGVRAAADIARELGAAPSAFEEPRPPATALVCGPVALGVGSDDATAARALAGRPLQQLDELLREAMVGDLLASQEVHRRSESELSERGIQLREHAGFRTAQKVFAIDLASVEVSPDGSTTPARASV
jgi:class 3 adenylate cyclase